MAGINVNRRYLLLQVLYWGAAVVNYAYMTQILEFKGYTQVEIGVLNGVKLLAGVVAQLWIGSVADRTRYQFPLKYYIAILTAAAGILTAGLMMVGHTFSVMLLIAIGFGVTFTTLQPLIDSLAMLYNNHQVAVDYARGRAGGSASWAVLCILAGLYCDRFGLGRFPAWGLILLALLAALAASMPWSQIRRKNTTVREDAAAEARPHSVGYLLRRYPVFAVFLIGSGVMFMGYDYGSTFLIDIYTGLGGGNTEYGIGEFVMAIAEVPAAFLIIRLRRRIPIRYMMVCCAVFMTLKNLIPTYTDSVAIVIAAQACEMLGLGLYYAGSIYFVEETLPQVDIVKGAALVSIATIGLGEGVASLLCGVIRSHIGLYGLMKVGTLTNAAAIGIYILMCRMHDRRAVS